MPRETTFERELKELLAKRLPFEELELQVRRLHNRHGLQVPSPITGTLEATDPEDKFGG